MFTTLSPYTDNVRLFSVQPPASMFTTLARYSDSISLFSVRVTGESAATTVRLYFFALYVQV